MLRRRDSNTAGDTAELSKQVHEILTSEGDSLPFHNWTHTDFVRTKAVEFARKRSADEHIVEAAALVHDLNYVVARDTTPDAGRTYRANLLADCGFTPEIIERIEKVIDGAHTAWRRRHVDVETSCLSDADTLYKALPITPVLFAHRYLRENDIQLADLAKKILAEQAPKLSNNYFFYDRELVQRYGSWAEANLKLWAAVLDSLGDPDVARLVEEESGA